MQPATGFNSAERLLHNEPRPNRRRRPPHHLIEKLRRLRIAQGMLQRDLGARLGYAGQSISEIESGLRVPNGLQLLTEWAAALDCEIVLVWKKEHRALLPNEL